VPANSSVDALLAAAQREFDLANTAYAAGDLGGYQRHNKLAAAYVQDAIAKSGSTATTTTIAPRTTTTARAATTTTSVP